MASYLGGFFAASVGYAFYRARTAPVAIQQGQQLYHGSQAARFPYKKGDDLIVSRNGLYVTNEKTARAYATGELTSAFRPDVDYSRPLVAVIEPETEEMQRDLRGRQYVKAGTRVRVVDVIELKELTVEQRRSIDVSSELMKSVGCDRPF